MPQRTHITFRKDFIVFATTNGGIDHLHYDVIRAKPDCNCSRPAETGPSFPGGKASG